MEEDNLAPRVLTVGRLYEEEIPAAPLVAPLSREDLQEMEHEVQLAPLLPHEEMESMGLILPGEADPVLDEPAISTDMRETARQVPLDFFSAHKGGLLGPGDEVDLSKDGRKAEEKKKSSRRSSGAKKKAVS